MRFYQHEGESMLKLVQRVQDEALSCQECVACGFDLESAPKGHGLDNLRSRLLALFGVTAELTVNRSDWTTVTVKVPV